jgi:hypothetical protein
MKDKLAIIVPYRDRQEHLDVFVPHMHEFLKDKGIDYTIFIAEQTDDRPFNYGKLCNVVTKEIGEEYTYFAFHDIDMLPISDECDYGYPDSPTHLATNVEAHNNELPYPQYFGGVILINREDFENVNGYSNEYWGYGFEDLDLLYRLQRSGAYLEKYYDLNQTYSRYDEDDILPYRIENVKITNKKRAHTLKVIDLDKNTQVKGRINTLTKNTISNSFSISLWFKDYDNSGERKNIFSLEGLDSGIFIDKNKYVINQIWDDNQQPFETTMDYFKNKWNHVVYSFDLENKELGMWLNNIFNKTKLPEDFKIHPHYAYIKISDETNIKISSIILFNNVLDLETVSELYFNGFKTLDLIKNKKGYTPCNLFDFESQYSKNIILDKGKNLNHLQSNNGYTLYNEDVLVTDELYLPLRLQGKYKSLVHDNDSDIIKRYYKYDPDIEENADIFFHDVISNNLDYKSIGLSTLKYTLLDKQDRENYELIRIVT